MLIRRSSIVAGGLLAALILGSLTAASPARAQRDAQSACSGDAQRLCNAFIPDRRRVASCLARNRAQLSPACRAFFTKRKAKGKRRS
jgi:hypothetical protein